MINSFRLKLRKNFFICKIKVDPFKVIRQYNIMRRKKKLPFNYYPNRKYKKKK